MKKYEGKSIFFIGDSITANGSFVHKLRLHFKNTGKKIYLHNKGIPGGTAELVHTVLGEELYSLTPDYAVISFGANDVGYWEYRRETLNTEALTSMRYERLSTYKENYVSLTRKLCERGIMPILCAPFPLNPCISAQGEVKTVVDLKEKAQIDTSFYNPDTFAVINEALCEMGDFIREHARENGFEFWDMHNGIINELDAQCFEEDGIHYSLKGDEIIARFVLKRMTGENLLLCQESEELDSVKSKELDERSYYFIKYNLLREKQKGLTNDELIVAVREWLNQNGYIWGLTQRRVDGFFRYANNPQENQEILIDEIREM